MEAITEDDFSRFAREVEPKLRYALAAGFGIQRGRDAAARALAYGWEHWDRISRMDNPAGYLYRVGHRVAAGRRRAPAPSMPTIPARQPPWIEPGLSKAMGRLSLRQRQTVVLIDAFGWTHGEVAEFLDVGLTTVQKHRERGLEKLRRALGVGVDV